MILCAGAYPALQRSLSVAALRVGEVNRIRSIQATVAGKSVNAARALLRLGQEVSLTGFCGGANGAIMLKLLLEEGLPADQFVETRADVRICHTILPDGGGPFTELVEEGPELPRQEWDALVRRCHALMKAQAGTPVILSGTMPPHAPEDFYARVLEQATGPVILDTSGPSLLASLSRYPAYVKINASELFHTIGEDLAPDDAGLAVAAGRLLAGGAGAVGVTRGAGTAWLFCPSGTWRYQVPQVKTVSALGSGDCVNAGFMVGLLAGKELPAAFAYGLACGTANAETASPAQFRPDRVRTLLPQKQQAFLPGSG